MPTHTDDKAERETPFIPLAGLMKSHPETAFDYLEFRFMAAGMSARLAAERGTEKDRGQITRAFQAMVAAYGEPDSTDEYLADKGISSRRLRRITQCGDGTCDAKHLRDAAPGCLLPARTSL